MVLNKSFIALLSFIGGAVFAGLATFSVQVGSIPEVTAALFCFGIGFVIDHSPA